MARDQRSVFVLEFPTRCQGQNLKGEDLPDNLVNEALSLLVDHVQRDRLEGFPIDGGSRIIKLKDAREENGVYSLLLTLGDPDAPDQSYEMGDDSIVHLPRPAGAIPSFAAHLVIKRSVGPRFAVLLERVKGLGPTVCGRALTYFLRNDAFRVQWVTAAGTDANARVLVKLDGLASKRLTDSLDAGRLTGMSLVRTGARGTLARDWMSEEEQIVKMGVKPQQKSQFMDALAYMVKRGKEEDFQDLTVRFYDENSRPQAHKIELDGVQFVPDEQGNPTLELGDFAFFIRQRSVSGRADTNSSRDKLEDDFISNMISVLDQEIAGRRH